MRTSLFALSVLVGIGLAFARPALAQENQKAATAQVLYEEGRRLVADGRAAEGCAKLAESNRIDPAVGTRFYLADCYERTGRTASAWALFLEVASASNVSRHAEREALARTRAAALESRLSRLAIVVDAPVDSETVRRGDVEVGRVAWATLLPVDPGEHTVTASASGRKRWSGNVTVAPNGASVTFRVPPLEVASPEPVVATSRERPSSSARTLGFALGAFGLACLGVGAVTGVRALSKDSESRATCTGNACAPEGKSLREDALTSAWVSNIAFAVGGVSAAVGVALVFFVAPSSRAASPGVGLRVGPSSVGIGGAF